jgi:hypothetical protein
MTGGLLVDVTIADYVCLRALVFRVRFTTVPALMMRSNSKQPCWLTGDMMSTPALACLVLRRGVSGFMPAERIAIGFAGVCGSWGLSSVAAMTAAAVTFTEKRGCVL